MTGSGRRIAIIGAGFSGSLLAVQLLRQSRPGDRFYLIERSAEFGRGLAYGTGDAAHLLNVRAGNMSAFADRPDDFLEWIHSRPPEDVTGVSTTADRLTFAPRRLYGAYIQHILAGELRSAERTNRLFLVAEEAIALRASSGGLAVEVEGGRTFDVDAATLALGNFPAEGGPKGYKANPWDPEALESLDIHASVLLIGTGLTMVDVALSLLGRGHRGHLLALSRRGLLPRIHMAVAPREKFLPASGASRTVLGLLTVVRREVARAAIEGADWRAVIDSLRPDTQKLWLDLPLAEKQRFLRHLRPWWDVHRHRMAPSVAARLEAARRRGQIEMRRARVGHMTPFADGLDVELLPVGGAGAERFRAARVINCSGPLSDMSQVRAPLIRSLLDKGRVRADPLNLGLDVTREGAVIDRSGLPSQSLFAIGPITKGIFWECTAVPDIRVQCERLACRLLERHESPVKSAAGGGRPLALPA